MNKTCRSCQKAFPLTKEFFFSNGKTPKGSVKWKPTCKKCETSERKLGYAETLEEVFGEIKCSVCGYDKHKGVIDCHHLDPSKKDFEVTTFRTSRRDKNLVIKELKKCVLLCANCHREVHLGILNLGD